MVHRRSGTDELSKELHLLGARSRARLNLASFDPTSHRVNDRSLGSDGERVGVDTRVLMT